MACFDASFLKTFIVGSEVKQQAERLKSSAQIIYSDVYDKNNIQIRLKDLLLAIKCIDLTTLAGDDSFSNVYRLCHRAENPLSEVIKDHLEDVSYTTGAVCVYPQRVADCRYYLNKINSKVPIASVVAGFPSGVSPVTSTLNDISYAVESGAKEIDIVIERSLVIGQKWEQLYSEIKDIADHCKKLGVHLKVILSCGELGSLQNIYKASMCAMMAGADFIKTSTGKEVLNAKLVYGIIMTRAIADFYSMTGIQVGLKPAGGIKEPFDALCWIQLVRQNLSEEWFSKELFRIGASSLLNNIEREIFQILFQRNPSSLELSF